MSVFAASMSAQRGNNVEARKLQLALYAISNLYVDSTNETKLVEDAIVGMLEKLDPHSTYTDPEETKEMTEPLQGNFDGIGIQFNMLTDTLYVIQVIPGGPSEKVGLMAGDRIIMVDDTLIAGVKMKNTDVMKRLRGPKNTEVRVKVLRGGVPDLIDRYNRGELMSADSIHFPDSMKYNTLETKRIVYGGGGIMPDVFIPVDTSRYTDYHRSVVAAGLVNRIAMNYLDRHRAELNKKYPKFVQYKQDFNVTDDMMQELVALAKDEKIEFKEEQYNRSKPLIMLQIKALIARDLYDMTEYFQVINDDNESFQEALRLINDEQRYEKELGR